MYYCSVILTKLMWLSAILCEFSYFSLIFYRLVWCIYREKYSRSAGVKRLAASFCLLVYLLVCLFVCLSVRTITQKRMIPKCSNLVHGMTLVYPTSDMILGSKSLKSRSLGYKVSCGFRLRNASDCVWMETRLKKLTSEALASMDHTVFTLQTHHACL